MRTPVTRRDAGESAGCYKCRMRRFSLPIVLALAASACGDDNPMPTPDAGIEEDSGIVVMVDAGTDAGVSYSCEMTVPLSGELGTVALNVNTADAVTLPRDLGLACGNAEAARWAKQVVVEYTVPGSGPVTLNASLVNEGTPSNFDTVLQVRTGSCETVPGRFPPSCFDDATRGELRSAGVLTAQGGETVYFFVTGYAETEAPDAITEGMARLEVTAEAGTPPTLESVMAFALDRDGYFEVSGMDAGGDAAGVAVVLRNAMGEIVDLDGDGRGTAADRAVQLFDESAEGMTTFRAGSRVLNIDLRGRAATQAEIAVFDAAFAVSDPMTVDIVDGTTAGEGEACDPSMREFCRSPMSCVEGVCAATGPLGELCAGAETIELEAPMGTATTGMGVGNVAGMQGLMTGSCGQTPGAESIFSVVVPEGTFDVLATTENSTTGMNDTVLYVRSSCPDPTTELSCNDDIAMRRLSSSVELRDQTAGELTFVVELYGNHRGGSVGLDVTLRPVLAAGEACDAMGVENRCAMGSCTDGMCPAE